jgi:flagellar hook-associated protein 3 FlgL
MPNDDMQYRMRRQEAGLSDIQAKIASQSRIRELRDDPLAASHAVRYESYLARLERFEQNTLAAREHYNYVDGTLRQVNDIMQRVRELSVQGANGIYSQEDLRNMGVEVNELLKEMVSLSNQTGPDGKQLFAGDKAYTVPFRVTEGTPEGAGTSVPVRVEYRGAGAARATEIHERTLATLDMSGGEAFWAEKMQVISRVDGTNYQAAEAASFFIDGEEISVSAGDSMYAIAAKINDSGAPVKAHIDPQTNGLSLEGTNAHLITLEDGLRPDGTLSTELQDLGLTRGNAAQGAPNWADGASVSGGSAFDMVIRLRDAMFRGDTAFIGGQGIGGMDAAMDNIRARIAEMGSREERVENAWRRINEEIPNVSETLSRETGLDLASAAMELGMMDMAHKAALQVSARILPQTLLDFLR